MSAMNGEAEGLSDGTEYKRTAPIAETTTPARVVTAAMRTALLMAPASPASPRRERSVTATWMTAVESPRLVNPARIATSDVASENEPYWRCEIECTTRTATTGPATRATTHETRLHAAPAATRSRCPPAFIRMLRSRTAACWRRAPERSR